MMRRRVSWVVAGIGLLMLSTSARANNACQEAETSTEQIAEALTASLTATTVNGEFQVKQTDDKDKVPMVFEINYAVDRKVIATTMIRRDAPKYKGQEYGFWSGYSSLEIKAEKNQLKLTWHTGGSGCCTCRHTIAPVPRGFRALIPRY
jgi:ribosomal protein L23